MRRRRAKVELPTRSRPAPCPETYEVTVRHILGAPGERRLPPLAVWYAHEIAWRPMLDTQGPADGPQALPCLERWANEHGMELADVLAQAAAAAAQDELDPELSLHS